MKKILSIIFLISMLFLKSTIPALAASKEIRVNLSNQTLQAYQNGNMIYSFPISSGKINTPTPTGAFHPQRKLLSDEMIGGNVLDGTYYDLPNVPYVVYFTGSYAIHGTYWHNNFGHPMSHGCINLRTSDMLQLYSWIDYGTAIEISGTTPPS